MKKQILAMGGGGFLMEPDNLLLDSFFLSLAGKPNPKVCFISTASGDAQDAIDRFYLNMKKHKCEPSHLALYRGPVGSLRDFILSKDVLYVGGGNTRNLLALWREWEVDKYILEGYANGVVLGGVSAGSICWFEEGVTDSIPGRLTALKCLGILKGSNCPHYDGEAARRPSYQALVAKGMKPGIACDDGVAGHFVDGELAEFVSSRKNAAAYQVEHKSGTGLERKIRPRFLGS